MLHPYFILREHFWETDSGKLIVLKKCVTNLKQKTLSDKWIWRTPFKISEERNRNINSQNLYIFILKWFNAKSLSKKKKITFKMITFVIYKKHRIDDFLPLRLLMNSEVVFMGVVFVRWKATAFVVYCHILQPIYGNKIFMFHSVFRASGFSRCSYCKHWLRGEMEHKYS